MYVTAAAALAEITAAAPAWVSKVCTAFCAGELPIIGFKASDGKISLKYSKAVGILTRFPIREESHMNERSINGVHNNAITANRIINVGGNHDILN
jgi:hypothetical protein